MPSHPERVSPVRPTCLRWLPLVFLLASYGGAAAGLCLGVGSSGEMSFSSTLGYGCLMLSLVLLLITPILAWVALRTQQARLLNIAVFTLAVFHLLSMFLA